MSKAVPCKKKVVGQSSTDSSSGSTSDSSTTSSSSSGSDSSTSSDSESSSSHSSKPQSGSEQPKKSAPVQKASRKSTENKTGNKPSEKPVAKAKSISIKTQKQVNKSIIYSSEDEQATGKHSNKTPVKRKVLARPRALSSGKNGNNVSNKAVSQINKNGVAKNVFATNKGASKGISAKGIVKGNLIKGQNKNKEKQAKNNKSVDKSDLNKKKSIFSPENSSESENDSKASAKTKVAPAKPRPKATAKAIEKPKIQESKTKLEPKPGPKSKAIISSASSATSSSESNSSSSDSESSLESSSSRKDSAKKSIKKSSPKEINSDSEPDITNNKQVTRKLTRSASTRKSKHVVGKTGYSDTDSDTESTKRSLSRSPVKRAPVTTKGKTKNKKNDVKKDSDDIIIEERACPIETCNNLGHLGGKLEKHFTVDACPGYHNVTINECKEMFNDRKKREENRKKLMESTKKSPKAQAIQDQKLYQQKIKDLRKLKLETTEDIKPHTDKNREPDLNNFVSDYDLKLFRDAQAIASEKIEEELKTQPNTKGTKYIEMGKFEMEVWYQSPYPEDYARLPKLYICEYCLRYMKSRTILQRHVHKCVWRHPPGEEVYRKDKISVWEVDGKRYKSYCQNLCLLAKFFLDHKTLYYDVEPFLFYVMTLVDNEGCHTVGYFSKEKNSFLNYNVSCILTLPPYQRQGYGRLLIDFSYLLTRVEGKIGSPEKPLSDLGLISYRSYWKDVLLNYLCKTAGTQLSVKDISQEMAIHSYDIVSTLQALGMMKYWKGKHIILRKQDVLDEYVERVKRRGPLLKEVDPSCLRWTPFVPPQSNPS